MSRIRTFIAIEIPNKVRERAGSVTGRLRIEFDSFRWVESDNLHLTLKFLGDVDDREVYGICRSVNEVAAQFSPFVLRCAGLGAFPKLERPRAVWIGIDDPGQQLENLFVALESSMAEHGFPREPRRFSPHVTLGRLKQGKTAAENLAEQIRKKIEFNAGEVPVSELVVFSSEMTSAGPLYTPMGRSQLGG